MSEIKRVLDIANAEVGYLEKNSREQLEELISSKSEVI